MTIREQRLDRTDRWDTFEEYCQERWGWTRGRAYQLMDAAEVVQQIGTMVRTPANERQARELGRLVAADDRRAAWQQVTQEHGENVTASPVPTFGALRQLAKTAIKSTMLPMGNVPRTVTKVSTAASQ